MKKIKYKIIGNKVETLERDLADFFSEFHFMYTSKITPSFAVMKDLCRCNPEHWGAGNRIEWERFELINSDYEEAIESLKKKFSLSDVSVPDEINSAYKWYLWQFEYSYGVPYENHKLLSDKENEYRALLKEAMSSNDKDAQMIYHLKSVKAADELADFIEPYLQKGKGISGAE